MVVMNGLDRFHLVADVIYRVPALTQGSLASAFAWLRRDESTLG